MFNFIDLYSFIPGSGCVDMSPEVLLSWKIAELA